MKLHQIITAVTSLNKLAGSDVPLPDAYRLQKLLAKLQSDIDFFNERRNKILNKYGTRNEDNNFTIPNEKLNDFKAEMDELGDIETQGSFAKVLMPLYDYVKISAGDIGAIAPFVEFIEFEK